MTPLIARSAPMRALVAALRRYAPAEANLLITGETGSGKDLVARSLHDLSARRHAPFVVVDCPGLPPTLLEAELFGYERGAFTDATVAKAGRFEQAGEGTVYLDRVDELAPDAQAKLLRLVERKQVERLGSNVPVPVRARVVASATSDLEHAVRDGRFRMDLYHRLRVLPLHVPPLRERRADLPALTRRLLADLTSGRGRPAPVVQADAFAALEAYDWPGNVRELRHVLERTLLATDGPAISALDLPADLLSPARTAAGLTPARPTLADLERQYIAFVLGEARGNQTRAAAVLGISRKALWEKRKRLRLEEREGASDGPGAAD